MSAFILRLRDALEGVTPDWEWAFSLAPGSETKFHFVAKQKETGVERMIYLNENVIHHLPFKTIVQDMVRLLPSKVKSIKVHSDNSIDVGHHYGSLQNDYKEALERLRRQSAFGGSEQLPV